VIASATKPDRFLLCVGSPETASRAFSHGLVRSYSHAGHTLFYDGRGVGVFGETAVFIRGYILPRNSDFAGYGSTGQEELAAALYEKFGRAFTRYLKGYFIIIIFTPGKIDVFTDQAGLFRAFYSRQGDQFQMAGTAGLLGIAGLKPEFDSVSLGMQALFNRVPLHYTVFKGICKTTYGDSFSITGGKTDRIRYWLPDDLPDYTEDSPGPEIEEFADLFRTNTVNFDRFLKPKSGLITLTGGKDSRTILTALLGNGLKPMGLTYGNKESRDAFYAGILAEETGIRHIVVQPPDTKEWFESEASKIIADLNPEINIHRSHRNYSFALASEETGRGSAFYAGYLGGELLMGIYFDDLIFTNFVKTSWETGQITGIPEKLAASYIKKDNVLIEAIADRIALMKCMDRGISFRMKALHGIFEIGIPHHSQDLYLSSGYWDYPYPFFLDIEFLELLFRSRYSFLRKDNKTRNPVRRYDLYSLNMRVQHILFPGLDHVPFGKRGYYTTSEYLKGPLFWSAVKGYRYLTDRRRFPPSFAYGENYRSFLIEALEHAIESRSSVNDCFETGKALSDLKSSGALASEKLLHKYSDIVMFFLLEQKLKR
jgi:hypothetical protein